VGALGGDLDIAPSTVSHHVKELQQAGLIRMERRGQRVECWVDPETLGGLAAFFQNSVNTDGEPPESPSLGIKKDGNDERRNR
jgi:ArsR family transcriptional regulator